MKKEMNETGLQTVRNTNGKEGKENKRICMCKAIGTLLVAVSILLKDTTLYMENSMVQTLTDVVQGMAIGMLLVSLIFASRYGAKVSQFKRRIFA